MSCPWSPPIEVFETDDELVVRAELGGLTTTAVQVVLSGDELILRGDRDVVHAGGQRGTTNHVFVMDVSRRRFGCRFLLTSSQRPPITDGFLSVSSRGWRLRG